MIGNIVTGREWPTRFSLEMLVHLLRFAEAEPSTPAHLRSQLRAIANHFSEYCQNIDSEIVRILKTESAKNNTGAGDPVYTAFFAGDFPAGIEAGLLAPHNCPKNKPQ